MTQKLEVALGIAITVGAFAFGRYSAPVKTVTETKVVEVEKKSTNTDEKQKQDTKTHEVIQPDGTKVIDTTTVVNTDTNTHETDKTSTSTDTVKTTIAGRDSISLYVLAGVLPRSADPTYGGLVSKNVLGPIRLGVFGFTDRSGGVALGIDL